MPPPWWGGCVFNYKIMNPEIQPTCPLDLAGVAVATPAAGLVKMKSTRVPRRRPHLSRVCEYAAVVGLGKDLDISLLFYTAL